MYERKLLTLILTYSGALPFIGALIAAVAGIGGDWPLRVFIGYGGIIASFMSGAIWTQARVYCVRPRELLLLSNAAALIAAATVIGLTPLAVSLVLQASCFVALLLCDRLIRRNGHQPEWYFTLRRNVTVIVVASYAMLFLTV